MEFKVSDVSKFTRNAGYEKEESNFACIKPKFIISTFIAALKPKTNRETFHYENGLIYSQLNIENQENFVAQNFPTIHFRKFNL